MDIYVARQPIFDREMRLFGYELLYRESGTNAFHGTTNDGHATASLLANSVLVIGFDELIEGTKGFVNFPEDFLVQQLPRLLPKQKIIVEILERVTPSREVINACRLLKQDGYTLALDDFIFGRKDYEELIELADMIKVEFSRTRIKDQMRFIQKYRGQKILLAEKLETMLDYRFALAMGYDLFQGYFFSKPLMINAKEIGYQQANLIRILKELREPEPDLIRISTLVQEDLGLTYKLLRVANTIRYGAKYRIKSVGQALIRIGTEDMIKWTHIMLLTGAQEVENAELVKRSLIRGKMLELIAIKLGLINQSSDYFITGIFSSLDQILSQPMQEILTKLPLDQEVFEALLGNENDLRICLDSVVKFEQAQWDVTLPFIKSHKLTTEDFMSLYLKAIKWQHTLSEEEAKTSHL
ncbi:HDOD domain-containing protein [Sporolactobacillus sp. STCC-11]|uniref:EAL and HDOD domain-containing protein n=1 Tax=Sporolactobacillus caesalpiniae TaxID=3230362 RepID=UPI00339723AE